MASFIKSAVLPDDWIHDQITEICLIGRSNVGKSSLINALAKSKIAITSKTPGRTRTVNFYDFFKFRLVDLPGYGYANSSQEKIGEMRSVIDTYLSKRINLYGVFQVIDASVVTKLDMEMGQYLSHKFIHHFLIINKVDKLNQSEKANLVQRIKKFMKIDEKKIILISVRKDWQIPLVWKTINDLLKTINIKTNPHQTLSSR